MIGPLLVDVDTGVDDAIALAFLVRRVPELLAVTTVAGNVPIDFSTPNTRNVVAWLGREDIPVHRGASRPLSVPYHDAAHVHGGNGLGNTTLPESPKPESAEHAVDAILRLAAEHEGELIILMLGPLTNLAIALSLRPALVDQIRKVVIMGGTYANPGNITPHAEFNIYADPHAAQQVFAAKWPQLVALGLDVTHQTVISRSTWNAIPWDASRPSQLARLILARSYDERNLEGFYLHDPLAALTVIDPEIVGVEHGRIEVTDEGDRRGQTTFTPGDGNHQVATSVRASQAEQSICDALDVVWLPHDDVKDRAE
ncbi:MAG: nucleoside hydrolase [Thermomicrobiales bacterium]